MAPTSGPSALVERLLKTLTRLRRIREMQLGEMMKLAGSTQQAWSRWEHGASPRVDSLEAVARALDADLVIEVRDRRARHPDVPPGLSAEAIEVAAIMDTLEEQDRKRLRDAAVRMAGLFRVSAEARNPADKAE